MNNPPELRTAGVIARELGQPLTRVLYVIAKRGIKPIGRAGTLRLFDRAAVDVVAKELAQISSRRKAARAGVTGIRIQHGRPGSQPQATARKEGKQRE